MNTDNIDITMYVIRNGISKGSPSPIPSFEHTYRAGKIIGSVISTRNAGKPALSSNGRKLNIARPSMANIITDRNIPTVEDKMYNKFSMIK